MLVYLNVGFLNEFGEYDMEGEEMVVYIKEWVEFGLVNIVGGCCGSILKYIVDIVNVVVGIKF